MNPRPAPAVHPLRAGTAEFAPVASLESVARDRLLRLVVGLAFLHFIVAFGHLLNPAGWSLDSPLAMLQEVPWSRRPPWVFACASGFFLLILRLLLPRLPLRWAHPLGALVATLTVLNTLGWFVLGITPEKTVPLAFAVFGAGCLLFTTRSLVLVIVIAVGGWLWFAREAGFSAGWPYFGGVLITACIISILFQRLHLQVIKQMLRAVPEYVSAPAPEPVRPAGVTGATSEESDEHFRRWYEATFEGIALHEKGVILETNQALATMLHCELSALPGKNLLDWFTRASRDLIQASILLGNFRPFEAVALRPDKTELPVELFTKRISYGGKEVMVTAFRDMTERQRAAAAHDSEQKRLQQQYVRQHALARLAVSTGESTEVARILDCIVQTTATVLPVRGGACIFIYEDGQFALAAEHLMRPTAGFEAVVQLGRVAEWIRENRETFVASNITRDDPFEVNRPVELLSAYVGVPLLDGDRVLGVFFALETEEPRHFTPDEMDFIGELANRATVAIAKAQLYAQLSEANRRLQRQSALLMVQNEELAHAQAAAEIASDAKSEFLAKVSHELRTPMNGVIGMTDYLLTTGLNPDQRESAETVRASANRLMTQIDRILDFSRLETGDFAMASVDFSVRELAQEAAARGERLLDGKPVTLRFSVAGAVPAHVRADRSALRHALWNLIENAVRFTDRGEITLTVQAGPVEDGKTNLCFAVSDTGRGISAAAQSKLFDPFAQVENSLARQHEGLGLGLSTAKRIIERMDGRISVQSEMDRGSSFTLTVPVELAEAPAPVAVAG